MECSHEHGDHHGHDHSQDAELERGQEFSLYQLIDTTKVRALNEKIPKSVLNCFKPWNERRDTEKFVESNDDEELIIYIPFTASIKLKSIMIIGGREGHSPKRLKVFTNRDDIDFSNASDTTPVQEWELFEDPKGEYEYPTKITKFNSVNSLTLYIPQNFGAEKTIIYYIGLKGDFVGKFRREAVITAYESKPQMQDHKTPAEEAMGRQVQ